ncbi:MAG: CDP-diacylglycerol--glycerol-3-phosphate 3-phosphatidyltransferase [Clostridia bacterium]|nr:CDP-diacylglycerol--glycerol-3-phosphate 3-phosphatidyltransferase [Clostridia bacterium]
MNIPNFLTILRLFMVPAFIVSYSYNEEGRYWAAAIFVLAALTDVLDGYLARKWNQITDFGKLADPVADKMMQLSALACLCISGRIRFWIILIFAMKELLLILGSLRLLNIRKYVVYSKWSGKIATVLLFVAIIVIMVTDEQILPATYATLLMVVCLIATAVAFFDYVSMYFKIKNARQPEHAESKGE